MILEQFYLDCLAHASYLVADEEAGVAAIVDPQRDIDRYVARAAELGVKIEYVLLTHYHADFVSGHLELQRRCGAQIALGAAPEYEHRQLSEGDVVQLGRVRIEVLETPGHTPEGLCYVVVDEAGDGGTPHAVLTGDTLFIGDVGRPDLLGAVGCSAEQLAGMMYDSLRDKLMKLPDDTLVYPAHGAGSACGKNLSSETVSTIGAQKRDNYALQAMSKDEFVALLVADQPTAPKYFGFDALLNRKERDVFDQGHPAGLVALSIDDVRDQLAAGAQIVDTREDDAFAAGSLKGAYNIPLSGSFASWCGSLLDLDRPVVVLTEPGRETESLTRLARVGIDRVAGYVDGGLAAAAQRPDLVQTGRQLTVAQLRARFEGLAAPHVVDVRTPTEWADGHIPTAQHIPLIELKDRLSEIPTDRPLAVICKSGKRATSAVSILRRNGIDDVEQVVGGMGDWEGAVEKVGS